MLSYWCYRSALVAVNEYMVYDVHVTSSPTLSLLQPCSRSAHQWFSANLQDAVQYWNGVAVEWRYVRDVVFNMLGDGLVIVQDGCRVLEQDGELVLAAC